MTGLIKHLLRALGLRRYKLEKWHYELDCRFPTRFLDVWLVKPVLVWRWLQNTFAGRTMLCFPDVPMEVGYELRKIAMVLGLRLTNRTERPHLAIAWQDTTVRRFSLESEQRKAGYFLNSRCTDIGKDRVEAVFESVFGYSLRVDPTTHSGPCVRKSIANAKHDGVVITCPINKAESGYSYQRLIDNGSDDQHVVDLRTPVYRDTIPLVLLKYRPIKTRFGNLNTRVKLARPDDIFSAEEQALILRFTRAIEVDFCNLDVLRDNSTGKIYIVDINTTAFGPTRELVRRDKRRAIAILAAAFQEKFIDGFSQLVLERTVPLQTLAQSQ
jgi:hypothetical protein